MKKVTLVLLLFISTAAIAQNEMSTKTGSVNFEASVPLFEEVKATNKTAFCVLNTKTGAITSTVLIKDFRFKIPMMEEHFNDNYMKSADYPKATFKGVIEGFNMNIIDTSPKEFKLRGILKLHGKSKNIYTIAILRKVDYKLEIISDFEVNSADFNIRIPDVLSLKVAKTVTIKTEFLLNRPTFANNP
jgi:hypothetical protein